MSCNEVSGSNFSPVPPLALEEEQNAVLTVSLPIVCDPSQEQSMEEENALLTRKIRQLTEKITELEQRLSFIGTHNLSPSSSTSPAPVDIKQTLLLAYGYLHAPSEMKDEEEAFKHFLIAANAGNARAQTYLGSHYLKEYFSLHRGELYLPPEIRESSSRGRTGITVPNLIEKIDTGISYLEMAVKQEDPEASFWLGSFFEASSRRNIHYPYFLRAGILGHDEALLWLYTYYLTVSLWNDATYQEILQYLAASARSSNDVVKDRAVDLQTRCSERLNFFAKKFNA